MRRIWVALGGALVIFVVLVQSASADGAAPSLLVDKVTLELSGNDTAADVHLLIGNDGDSGLVSVQFLDDATGHALPLKSPGATTAADHIDQQLGPHTVTAVDLTAITGPGAHDGHVVVQPTTGKAATAEFHTSRKPSDGWLYLPFIGFVVALVVVALAWMLPADQPGLSEPLGVASGWKFDDSWASNITALGAVTGTVLGLAGFLDDVLHDVQVTRFVGLNAAFLAIVAGAPLVFSTFAKRYDATPVGSVGGFLAASVLVLTAGLGELGVLGLMLYMARGNAGLWLVAAMLVAAAAVLILYVWRSIGAAMKSTIDVSAMGLVAGGPPVEQQILAAARAKPVVTPP